VDQTQHEFLVEIEELVEQIFLDLDELREATLRGRAKREQRAVIDRIFRRVHSIKGSAASTGLEALSKIAHEFENLLEALRSGQTPLDDVVLDACESATQALSESLSLAASGLTGTAGIVEPSRQALFDQLQAAAQSKPGTPKVDTEAVLETIPFEVWQSLTEPEKHRLVTIVEERSPLFVVATSFDLSNFDEEFFRLKQKLVALGEVISTSPTVDDQHPDKINFRVLFASEAHLRHLEASVVEFSEVSFNAVAHNGVQLPDDAPLNSLIVPTFASVSSLSSFVRTDLEKLDQLISSTHEIFRTTSNALGVALSYEELPPLARDQLRTMNEQIRNSFMSVEHDLINLRMVSLGPTLQRAARAGRTAARLAGKEIDFEIVGAEIQLDKLLANAIADSLVHLVRNAVDHGIENAEARIQGGKKPRGTVRIEAVNEGSQSRVRVTDDGGGIDQLQVSEAAKRLGIVEADSDLDLDRSVRLIFRPGFTTLDSVSDVSGRGVGLDVVETAVEQVGGELRVSSQPSVGTTFEIRLPVTFGLLAATIVVSAANRYCIPSNQTLGIDAIAPIDTKKQKSSALDELPLFSLRTLLGHSATATSKELSDENRAPEELQLVTCQVSDEQAATTGNGFRRVGISVDRVEGTEEVLVRTLGRHAGRWYGVAGATELRDGSVALVLDLPRLLSR
jgi:two-component system, chemotaxis family, sensor kinase CheA